ncbi:MAG: hypothetical protein WBA45_12680 [Microthrixaceae bacterium]
MNRPLRHRVGTSRCVLPHRRQRRRIRRRLRRGSQTSSGPSGRSVGVLPSGRCPPSAGGESTPSPLVGSGGQRAATCHQPTRRRRTSSPNDVAAGSALEFEWAPPPAQHFRGGSAFDAAIFYSDGHQRRLIGVECKYSEDLRKNDPRTVRDVYREFTEHSGYWHEEAGRRLDRPGLRQLWINTLLAQSVCDRGGYERCTHVVVACGADASALASVERIRTELHDPDAWLQWSPYETVLGHLGSHNGPWAAAFEQRYVDFSPVTHLLSSGDPRLVAPEDSISGLQDLAAMGERVTGAGGVLEQVIEALERRRMNLPGPELRALDTRAAELAVDLKTFRQALADAHGRIDP